MALDGYELIRTNQFNNIEILCILSFLETLCEERQLRNSGVFGRTEAKLPDMAIMITILRAINRVDKQGISKFLDSPGSIFLTTPEDLDKLVLWTSEQYNSILNFILEWIETNMCETEFGLSQDSSEKLYHAPHLAIPRIYGVLLARETFQFYSRVTTTYRDSFQSSRSPSFNEELQLNDYTKWAPDAVLPAFDENGVLRFITPFKMKVYAEDGILWRELIGGDVVLQPTIASIVRSFKKVFDANIGLEKKWYQALSLQYKGVYWDDDEDLVSSKTSKPGKPVDGSLAISRLENNTVVYNNQIFSDQLIKTLLRIIEDYDKAIDEITIYSPDITIEKSQAEMSSIVQRFISSRQYKILTGGIPDSLSTAKYTVFGITVLLALTSGIVKVGIQKYYANYQNFFPVLSRMPWTNIQGKAARKFNPVPGTWRRESRTLALSRIKSYDKMIHKLDVNILAPLKYAYGFLDIIKGNFGSGIGSIVSTFAVGKLAHSDIVDGFLEGVSKSKAWGRLISKLPGGAVLLPAAGGVLVEIAVITALTEIISLGIDYVESKIDENRKMELRRKAMSLGYAPDAYANYNLKIPMSQFGHIIDVPVLNQFLSRQEILTEGGRVITGDTIKFLDRKVENYDWSKNEIIGERPLEGLWPVNFAPLESIERAKSGVKIDFDDKLGENPPKDHPDLKSKPPKLESKDDVSLFFPQYPWGITPSICIPTFEDAAKEAVKNNFLAQGDLNNIYEYNEFMNTVGKIVTTPLDGLVPNISKATSISFAESYVNTLSQPLLDKLINDTRDVLSTIDEETDTGEFTSGTNLSLDSTGQTLIIEPHRRISQSEEIVFTSRPSIRPNSENKTKDGKNIPIGQRTSTSDYVKKSIRTYFPDNKITRPYNNDYKSNVPPITVKIALPSFANGNGLRDVSSPNPLVRILTKTERNALRSSSSPGSVSNIEDHILTDVSIKLGTSDPKLDTDLFEKGCELKRPERGDKPNRPDRDTGPRDTGPGVRTCFPSYVKVLTPNGYMEISSMNIGDKITAFNEDGNLVESSVTYKFIHDDEEMSEVFEYELSNGNKLHITDNHPVLVPSGEFLQIGWLNMGDSVVGENNEEIQIISKKFVEKTIVYNLEVEKYHTYIAEGVRVHNLTNKWAGKGSGFDPRMGGRNRPGLIIIDSSEWENGGGQGDDTKNSEAGNQEAVGSGRDNPFLPTCFPSWSIVTTENGKKPISEILVGDKIFTLNRESGKIETSVVTDVKKHEDENHSVSRYELSDGGHIDITKNHPVLTPSGYFKSIGKLTIGDLIITENGESVSIINEYHLDDCHVYNLQVESNGSYIVDGIVVSDR
jgi:hypothetical protein